MTEIKERTEEDSERIEETAKAMYDDMPHMFYSDDLNSYDPWEYAPTYVKFNARQMAKSAIKGADGYLGRRFTEEGTFVCGTPHCDVCAAENDLNDKLGDVYRERNQLVAALSKHYPSYLGKHDGDSWEAEWLIVYIELPNGQVSWHTHASDLDLFEHLERREGDHWDGHNTEEKYQRLADLTMYLVKDPIIKYVTLTHEDVWNGAVIEVEPPWEGM